MDGTNHLRTTVAWCCDYTESTDTDLNIADANFSVVLLCLQLQLDVEEGNLRVLVTFRLHLKASIGEGLFKGHSSHQLRLLQKQTVRLLKMYMNLDIELLKLNQKFIYTKMHEM